MISQRRFEQDQAATSQQRREEDDDVRFADEEALAAEMKAEVDAVKARYKSFIAATIAIADAIRELKQVPSGHLYARVMEHMSLEAYETIIATLIRAGVVRRDPSHLLTWIA